MQSHFKYYHFGLPADLAREFESYIAREKLKKAPTIVQAIRELIQSKEQQLSVKPLTLPKSNKVKSNRQSYDTAPRAITARNTTPAAKLGLSMRERLKKYYN
jgi:hypothetical protein